MTLLFPRLRRFYDLANPLSYALLRVAFGVILFTHGLPKVLGGAHGAMANPFASSLNFITNTLHFPAPLLFGYFVMLLESAGALMLAAGLFTRLIAPMIAIEMAMICVILYPNWVWLDHGMEYALLMGFVALHMSFRGGGGYSIDRLLRKEL
jgi:putative oxidoreductase